MSTQVASARLSAGRLRKLRELLMVALGYLLLARASLLVASFDGIVSVFWLPAGWAVFACWRFGWLAPVAILLAQVGIGLGLAGGEPYPLLTGLLFATGNAAGYALLTWLFQRPGLNQPFARAELAVRWLLAIAATHVINAGFGCLGLVLGRGVPWAAAPELIWNWWGGDVGGALALAPALFAFAQTPPAERRAPAAATLVGIGAALLAALLIFLLAPTDAPRTLLMVVLPPLLWLAFRPGPLASGIGLLAVILFAAAGTVRDTGLLGHADAASALLQLQVFSIVLAVTVVLVVATNQERRLLYEHLAQQAQQLEEKVQQRTEDISRSNVRLRQLSEDRSAMLSLLAHDLKNPLTSATGAVALARSLGTELSTTQREALLDGLDRSLRRMFELVTSVLDLQRAEEGLVAQPGPLRLDELARAVVDDFREMAARKRLAIEVVGRCQGEVINDRLLLREILDNLVSNAVKYSRPGDRVTVEVVEDAVVRVADTGPGIPADELPRLFERFARLSPRPSAGENSSGLGLSMVKAIAERLNSRVEVASDVGKGTAFTLIVGRLQANR